MRILSGFNHDRVQQHSIGNSLQYSSRLNNLPINIEKILSSYFFSISFSTDLKKNYSFEILSIYACLFLLLFLFQYFLSYVFLLFFIPYFVYVISRDSPYILLIIKHQFTDEAFNIYKCFMANI